MMKKRGNVQQVSEIARFESRLIEGLVVKVFIQTRTALVRIDGSNQQTMVNLGHVDPYLVANTNSRLLLYRSRQALYAISVMQGQYAPSSAGVTLGDRWGSTRFTVYNSSTYHPYTYGSSYDVALIDSSGCIRYRGDLKPNRAGVEYTGLAVIDKGVEEMSSDVTLSDSALDCISKTVTVPANATLRICGFASLACSALTVAQNVSAQVYIDGSNQHTIPVTFRNSGDWKSVYPVFHYTPTAEESVTFKLRGWKSSTSNTVRMEKDYTRMEWDIIS